MPRFLTIGAHWVMLVTEVYYWLVASLVYSMALDSRDQWNPQMWTPEIKDTLLQRTHTNLRLTFESSNRWKTKTLIICSHLGICYKCQTVCYWPLKYTMSCVSYIVATMMSCVSYIVATMMSCVLHRCHNDGHEKTISRRERTTEGRRRGTYI